VKLFAKVPIGDSFMWAACMESAFTGAQERKTFNFRSEIMKTKRRKGESPAALSAVLEPRHKGEPDIPPTQSRKYVIPLPVVVQIRKAAPLYGSQGRALQVATELMIRMKKPLRLQPEKSKMIRMTYKLLPRTIELIAKMAGTMYEDETHVIAACAEALKIKKL